MLSACHEIMYGDGLFSGRIYNWVAEIARAACRGKHGGHR